MQIMQDVIGSQKLIPCTLVILTFILIRSVPDIVCTTVQTVYSTVYRCLFTSTSKEWTSISASLPDPKGPLSDCLPTASPERRRRIAEANKEVLKAVAEAKELQKKGP